MNCYRLAAVLPLLLMAQPVGAGSAPAQLRFKDDCIRKLAAAVPGIMKTYDAKTGRFGEGVWICRDQEKIYPLAAAWTTESKDNPYYHDARLLDAIMAGGDVLAAAADKEGKWEFRKKDNSFWGMIHMPWTYSRWIRTYAVIKDAMPPERRKRWEDALTLGYGNIAQTSVNGTHNIQCHHAMGLYIAGKLLNHPEWCEKAAEVANKVASLQDPGGFWSEHVGPAVNYNFVYVDALGTYYLFSGDKNVLPALERASRFHSMFTYPDGALVETVDERNPYRSGVRTPNIGFSFTPEGRGFIAQQFELAEKTGTQLTPDDLACFVLYGQEGPMTPTSAGDSDSRTVSRDGKALVRRRGAWFICMSAYHCPIPESRWYEDRQNLLSIYHDRCGLIVGGGNTKLQPLWSNFTVGDTSLLSHTPGDTSPDFFPKGPLSHVPDAAGIGKSDPPALGLVYGGEKCSITAEPVDDSTIKIRLRATCATGQPVEGHITLILHLDKPLQTGPGASLTLADANISLSARDAGGWIQHAGWRLSLPDGGKTTWPVLPHNPYVKDGSAKPEEGRIVVSLPFSPEQSEYELTLEVER